MQVRLPLAASCRVSWSHGPRQETTTGGRKTIEQQLIEQVCPKCGSPVQLRYEPPHLFVRHDGCNALTDPGAFADLLLI